MRMPIRAIIASLLFIAADATAQDAVVRNVQGYALAENGVRRFVGLQIARGKVARIFEREADMTGAPQLNTIDGGGQYLLPGLIDAHGHVLELGMQRMQADLRGSTSADAALARVRRFAADNPNAAWIVGRGWNQVLWSDKQFPTAAQLDAVTPDRPALLWRVDGHAVWVNSAALKLAGLARTADPSDGQILRDAQGNPSGVLVDGAIALIEKHLPAPTDADIKNALRAALDELADLGLTGVHDAGVDARTYRLYRELGRAGQLPIRVYAMLADNADARAMIRRGPRPSEFDDRLQLRSIKAWADGALGSRGASLLADYSDRPSHRGSPLYSPAQLLELTQLAARHGWQLNVHAIGDAGNRMALDAFERGMRAAQRSTLRPRIEHAQVIALDDVPRFAQLNVIASMQPTHATSDMNMAEDRVGPERIRGAYAWRTLLNAGAHLTGGSDFPVELANPFHGLYAAVTRKDRNGHPLGGWRAQEKLTREEALRLFTLEAAHAARMENVVGALSIGQWADFILVDRDYFAAPEDAIDDIRVIATYVAGQHVTSR